MKITLRLILSLIVVVVAVALLSAWFQVRQEKVKLYAEVRAQSALVAETLREGARHSLEAGDMPALQQLAGRLQNQRHLEGLAVYAEDGTLLAASPSVAPELAGREKQIAPLLAAGEEGEFLFGSRKIFLYPAALPFGAAGKARAALLTNVSHIDYELFRIWKRTLLRLLAQMILISLVTLLVVRWNLVDPIAQMADWMKKLRIGEEQGQTPPLKGDIFAPIAREATTLAKNLQAARNAAQKEARLRQTGESLWTPERLKELIKIKMDGRPLFVVSNREPYMHLREGKEVRAIVPAGGLVTALDPILKAAGGTWIAHGSGDADFEVTRRA